MAKKTKGPRLDGSDILLAILLALAGGVAAFTIIAVAGSIMFPDPGRRVTAESPSAQSSYYGTLPSRAPTQTPTPEPEPLKSTAPGNMDTPEPTPAPSDAVPDTSAPAPSQAQTPATPTRAPETQNSGPVVSVSQTTPPVRQTQAPTQAGNQSVGGARGHAPSTNVPDGTTVYVSRTGKIHSISNCSNMRYYTAMTLGQARVNRNYEFCTNCWN